MALALLAEHLKEGPEFCVSCHLSNGEKLHAEKFKAFSAENPPNLAGQHRKKSAEKFTCSSCHSGRGTEMRGRVSIEEIKNTLAYFFAKFEEPKKFDQSLMPDENCEACHKSYKGGATSFHGMKAHTPKIKFPCIACHAAHPSGGAKYYFLTEKDVLGVCKKCHPNLPPSFKLNGRPLP
ncbi:MAG: hypothetical protein HY280_09180 [Nitrospinae bacterium]|nr:hypothetical protein [Nitrospinota bacterium]